MYGCVLFLLRQVDGLYIQCAVTKVDWKVAIDKTGA